MQLLSQQKKQQQSKPKTQFNLHKKNQKQKQPQKKKSERLTFKPQFLLKQNKGIKSLYQKSLNLKLSQQPQQIVNSLSKIVSTIKQWHFNLMPKYNYEYFLDRCSAFGNTKLLQSYMNKVRNIHKGQDQWDQEDKKKMKMMQSQKKTVNNKEIKSDSQDLFQNNIDLQIQKQPQHNINKQTIFQQKQNINLDQIKQKKSNTILSRLQQLDDLQQQQPLPIKQNKQLQSMQLQQSQDQSDLKFLLQMKKRAQKQDKHDIYPITQPTQNTQNYEVIGEPGQSIEGQIIFNNQQYIPSDFDMDDE